MKKVLLVAPQALSDLAGDLYNLASLATYIENFCEVKTISYSPQSFASTLKRLKPDIVGVTSYTTTYPEAIAIMKQVKALSPKALRLVGGVHVSCLPQSLDPVFDAGIIGEGESALRELVFGKSHEEVLGTCYFKDGHLKINSPQKPLDIENLPVPNLKKYATTSYTHGSVGFVTSRGCPFSCIFCYSKIMRKKVGYYPVEWVADSFEYAVKELKANFIMLWDDTICNDLNRLTKIIDEVDKRRLGKFRVAANMRSSIVSEELCEILQRLNVVNRNCGFESGSDRMLKQIKGAGASVDKHKEMVQLAHKFDVKVSGSAIFGMPKECIDDMEATIEFMKWLLHEKEGGRFSGGLWYFCAAPLPGTTWWDIAYREGKVSLDMDWSKLNLTNWHDHFLLESTVSQEQFFKVQLRAKDICEKINNKT